MINTFFFLSFIISFQILPNTFPSKRAIQVHLYGTGFCPHLIKSKNSNKNIIVKPVIDITQNNDYQCLESEIHNHRFHGHWILAEIINQIKNNKLPIEITPVIIFDKQGLQTLSYWRMAFQYSVDKSSDFILTTQTGVPLKSKKELIESAKIEIPEIPLLLISNNTKAKNTSMKGEATTFFPHINKGLKQVHIVKETPYLFEKRVSKKSSSFPKLGPSDLLLLEGSVHFLENCLEKIKESCKFR